MTLQGKTALVTGATDGVGKLVAQSLAKEGAQVLLHGRDAAKGAAVLEEIRQASGNPNLEFVRADLASLEEVRAMAEEVRAAHDRLHILVNNAGVGLFGAGERQVSRDGHELHFAVNYLSHFLLTLELLPAIKGAAPARIVNVSSIGQASIDFDDVMLQRAYSGYQGYCQSKLAQVMFTIDLAEKLRGSGVTVASIHPATFMGTNMVLGQGLEPRSKVEDGAAAVFRLAASPDVEGESGGFWDQKAPARANDQAYDPGARARLWKLSLVLTGLPGD